MKATEKEIKCIEFSIIIRNEIIQRMLSKLKEDKVPLILTPKFFKNHFLKYKLITIKLIPMWKRHLFFLMLPFFYLIQFLLNFIIRLIEIITGDKNFKKQQIELVNIYKIDFETSPTKSFEQLWNDKGLKNWGFTHIHLTGITREEQMNCINYWFSILYGKDIKELDLLAEKIRQQIKNNVSEYYKSHPNGYIIPCGSVQALPREIDLTYGNYI